MSEKCYLQLADGHIFEGERLGAEAEALGELVFTTGMCGYIETLTDPGYYGQIILQTFPLIGNYGMIGEDFESAKCHAKGYVLREACDFPSNFRSQGTLDAFLKAEGIPAICGVDTREITRIIRETGVMNARITREPGAPDDLAGYAVKDAVKSVGARGMAVFPAAGKEICRLALIDYGAKKSIARELIARGATVIRVPFDTPAEKILALGVHGVMLSNGPGDPAENTHAIRQIALLAGRLPIFGVCLGHQLLALALGGQTFKLKYGHRGANQPVKRLADGRVFITSQNHGYAVSGDNLPACARLSYINANDGTCEGLAYPSINAFSVQFHPEVHAGPQDTAFLFGEFLRAMGRE